MLKKEWRDVYKETDPVSGKKRFRRERVAVLKEGETPPPPENFPEGDIPSEKESTQPSETKEEFVPPTYAAMRSEAMDRKQDEKTNRGSLLESEE